MSDMLVCRRHRPKGAGMSDLDVLKDYTRFEFTDGRWTRPVYRRGMGPAVIVIHEMPGLHPGVAATFSVPAMA